MSISLGLSFLRRTITIVFATPFVLLYEAVRVSLSGCRNLRLLARGVSVQTQGIDGSIFPDEKEFSRILNRIGTAKPRTTGSQPHNELIDWVERELGEIPALKVHSDEYDILRWQPVDNGSLGCAGKLSIQTLKEGKCEIPVVGAVPFALPTAGQSGPLVYLPKNVSIGQADVRGKVILRDLPSGKMPYSVIFIPGYSKSADLNGDIFSSYDRPSMADMPLKEELIAAGRAGAAGMIIMFDIVREQVESYFEPHQGVHYKLPALFVGAEEAALLKSKAKEGNVIATLSINAEVSTAKTRNVCATLEGQSPERVIFITHTDGNTFVQENGPAAVLTLAQYFAEQPLSNRRRTIEFAFNTAHLHISREGTARHAEQLNDTYEKKEEKTVTLIIPVEHLGTREIEPKPRANGKPGRELKFSGRGEMMFWCVGPSPAVVKAVEEAVTRRKLDRVLITRGTNFPKRSQVPTFSLFGGIGTYYHNLCLPTTALISGPWSLWAPHFGSDAVDVSRLRAQTLAVGDIYLAVANLSRETIAAGYTGYRRRRAAGANSPPSLIPPEQA